MPNHAHPPIYGEKAPAFRVHVTRKHLNTAKRSHGGKCAIAEAVIDARGVSRTLYAKVDLTGIRFSDPIKDRQYIYHHSNKTAKALIAFDRGDDIKPFSFNLQYGQVRKRGYRACHAPGWKPQKNRSSRPKTKGGPKLLRVYGLCTHSTPKAAIAARHKRT